MDLIKLITIPIKKILDLSYDKSELLKYQLTSIALSYIAYMGFYRYKTGQFPKDYIEKLLEIGISELFIQKIAQYITMRYEKGSRILEEKGNPLENIF